jgi:hypothetical protein
MRNCRSARGVAAGGHARGRDSSQGDQEPVKQPDKLIGSGGGIVAGVGNSWEQVGAEEARTGTIGDLEGGASGLSLFAQQLERKVLEFQFEGSGGRPPDSHRDQDALERAHARSATCVRYRAGEAGDRVKGIIVDDKTDD